MKAPILQELKEDSSEKQQENTISIANIFKGNWSIRDKFKTAIHLCMLMLCLVATYIVLFTEDRSFVKIVLSLFMGLYIFFVTKNKIYQQIIFKEIYEQQYQQKYKKAHKLQLPKNDQTYRNEEEYKNIYKLKSDKSYHPQSSQMQYEKRSSTTPFANMERSVQVQRSNPLQKISQDESQSAPLAVVRSMSRSVIGSVKNVVDQMKNSVFRKNEYNPNNQNSLKNGSNVTSSVLLNRLSQGNSSSQNRGFDLFSGLKNNVWKKIQSVQNSSSSSHKVKCLPRSLIAVNTQDPVQKKKFTQLFNASLKNQNILNDFGIIWTKFKKGLLYQLQQLLKKNNKNWETLINTVQKYYNVIVVRQNYSSLNTKQKDAVKIKQSQIFNQIQSFNAFNLLLKQKKIVLKNLNQKLLAEQLLTKSFVERQQIDTILNINNSNYQIRNKKINLIRKIPSLIEQKVQPMSQSGQNLYLHSQAKVLCLLIFVNKINLISDVYHIKMKQSITNGYTSFLKQRNIEILWEKGCDNITPHYNLKFKGTLIHCEYGVNNPLSVLTIMFYKIWQEISKNEDKKESFDKKEEMKTLVHSFYSYAQF